MGEDRYTGLVFKYEKNEGDVLDMMLEGKTFWFAPTVGDEILHEEVVKARILQVYKHPGNNRLLIVLKTTEVDEARMNAGIWCLVFEPGLICDRIPEEPIDQNLSDRELVDSVRACVRGFFSGISLRTGV